MSYLAGRRALVTGAADGIGRAIAERFADEGARVIAVDIDRSRLEMAFAGRNSIVMLVQDVATAEAASKLARAAERELGGLDILVNNAGIPGELAMLHGTTDDSWSRIFAVNVDAVFALRANACPCCAAAGADAS